ncbi:homogentisate phytyltransferase 1, chloroplastic isoform X5 [Citrus clementina]|uniref:homogentisate phytyltransferase 1, chloroplastic isoform X5 n=1 Tax=Citrus clementina TaxID=85681 RepID=UPI000CECF126|nr:homogentisate phytyltransferase 1, chloroplastic isoform X5 [Citrus x clementina]
MESLLVGFSPSSALVSSGSSCWRNKDLMAGHFPSFYKGLQVSRCKVWNIIDRTTVVKLERYHLKHHIRGAKDRSIYHQKIKIKHLANAASGHPLQSNQPDDYKPKSPLNSVINALDAFYRFSRPHTVIGTALSIVSVALLAVEKVSDISPLFFTGVLEAIAAALMMNIYIVGLNQLSDIEIDKVNKPYLPLASGEYSFKTGVLIVASFSIMSFWLGWIVGSWPLFWALFTSFVLGTAYSINLPLLRWKRFAVAAAMCILAVRAVVVQLAFYLHMQDVPDLEGDKTFGIRTFTVRLGQKRVFWTCISLLEVAYTVAILVGATSPFAWSKLITVLGHSILALILWNRAKSVDIGSKTAITSCYMFIWKLFYAEYLLIPFVR